MEAPRLTSYYTSPKDRLHEIQSNRGTQHERDGGNDPHQGGRMDGMGWDGMGSYGMGWDGIKRDGMICDGTGWDGIGGG